MASSKVSTLIEKTAPNISPTDLLYLATPAGTESKLPISTLQTRLVGTTFFGENYGTLEAAVTAIGINIRPLIISTTLAANIDQAVPDNVILEFVGDGKITVAAGKFVTIHSDSRQWPLRQIFTGSGTIKFGSNVGVAYPQWFGMKADGDVANATVNTSAIQKCLDAFNPITLTLYTEVSKAGIVELTGGAWINDTIIIRYGSLTLRGQGWGTGGSGVQRSYLRAADGLVGKPMIKITDCWGSGIEKLALIGNLTNKPSAGIEFAENPSGARPHGLDYSFLSHIYIGNMYGYGPLFGKQFTDGITFTGLLDGDSNSFRHVAIDGCVNSGVDTTGNPNGSDTHWDTLNCVNCGIGFKVGPHATGTNWLFALNGVDISMFNAGSNLDIRGFVSEGSGRLATCTGQGTYLKISQGGYGLDTMFSPADSGDDRWIINAEGGFAHIIQLEDFNWANYFPIPLPNPVIRIGSVGSASDTFLKLHNTNFLERNIKVENPGATLQFGVYVESFSRLQDGGTAPASSRNYINAARGTEDYSYQAFRNDLLGKTNIFGGPLKVKKLFKPTGVNATNSVGSGATVYSYRLTALTYDGETEGSVADTCTNAATLDATHKNIITWIPSIGARAYRIYGRTAGSELLMITLAADDIFMNGPLVGWTDDGSITPSGALPTINGTGRFYCGAPNLAPTDTEIDPHGITFYLDETANKLKIRVKYADGTTMKTGEIALV